MRISRKWIGLYSFSLLLLLSCRHQTTPSIEKKEHIDSNAGEKIHISNIPPTEDVNHLNQLIDSVRYLRPISSDRAFYFAQKALVLSYRLKRDRSIAYAMITLSVCHLDKENIGKSKYFLLKAIPFCKDDHYLRSVIYYNMGNVYAKEGLADSAIHFHFRSLTEIKKNKIVDTSIWIQANINLANSILNYLSAQQALPYFRAAFRLIDLYKDTINLPNYYSSMAALYLKESDIDSAMLFYSHAVDLFRKQKKKREVQNNYYNMGVVTWGREQIEISLKYFDSAVAADEYGAESNALLQQALGVSNYRQGDYGKALINYQKSLAILNKQGSGKQNKLLTYQNMVDLYVKTGQSSLAYQYQKAYSDLKDSLFNTEKVKAANILEIKYRVVEKDKLLVQNELQITRQYLWIIGVGAGSIVSIAILLNLLRRKKHKMEIARLQATVEGEEQERSRMARELHDGIMSRMYALKLEFEALSHAQSVETSAYGNLALQLEQSIMEIRATAHNLLPEILLQEGLAGALQLFCDRTRQLSPVQVDFQMTGTLPALSKEMELGIYRIVQELVQNILKHAAADYALVQFTATPSWLGITIEDNGKGMSEEIALASGIGLFNLQYRVRALQGTLEIETNNGTSVYLEFPIGATVI